MNGNNRDYFISFPWGLGFAVCFVSLLQGFFFFRLVCDPKLISQIFGTFQETCQRLHGKTEEADSAIKELLSKLFDCCDKLLVGKNNSTTLIENHVHSQASTIKKANTYKKKF